MKPEQMMIFFNTFELVVNIKKSGDYITNRPFREEKHDQINEKGFVEHILKNQTHLEHVCHCGVNKELTQQCKNMFENFSVEMFNSLVNDVLFNSSTHPQIQNDGEEEFSSSAIEFKNTLISQSIENQLFNEIGDLLLEIRQNNNDNERIQLLLNLEEKISAYNQWVPENKQVKKSLL